MDITKEEHFAELNQVQIRWIQWFTKTVLDLYVELFGGMLTNRCISYQRAFSMPHQQLISRILSPDGIDHQDLTGYSL